MFLKKLKNNNRGQSTVNWAILIMITLFVLGIILDLVNLSTAKNIIVDRVTYLSNTATIQGGLGPSAPYGWGDLYNVPYITSSQAAAYFQSALTSYSFVTEASLDGTGYVGYHDEGVITGKATYHPVFTGEIGVPDVSLSHSARFCGFWIFRSTNV